MVVKNLRRITACILVYIFLMCPAVSYAADYETHWAAGAVLRAISAGLVSGDGNGDFHPDRNITRAEFVTIVTKRLNLSAQTQTSVFQDVTDADWFAEYLAAAADQEIITGYPDQTFRPHAEISRQDAVVLLCRAFGAELRFSASLLRFIDFAEVSDYAQQSLSYAVSCGLLAGYSDATVRPANPLTRAEALVLCEKFYTYFSGLEEKTVDFLYGYPKLSNQGNENKINLTVKVNQPCKIYYLAVNLSNGSSAFTPAKEMVNTLLVPAERANVEYYCSIDALPNTKYNIFLLATAPDGSTGKLHSLKNITPLPYTAGKGTKENPYLIYNVFQLDQIRNFPSLHFRLETDLTLTDPWEPIGSSEIQDEMFSGSLDGNGHKISNLTISNRDRYAGLFAYIFGGAVRNLSVDVNIQGKSDVGGIAGHLEGGQIENCTATGLVAADSTNAGGIVGTNSGDIRNCLSAVYVAEAMSYAGGIAGRNTGTIQNCLSAVSAVSADMYAGGIAGANFGGQINSCVAANMRTADVLTANSGRITTNRYNGTSVHNFGYDRMISNTNVSPEGEGSQDGTDVSWAILLQADFYRELGWDMDTLWVMPEKNTAPFLLPVLRRQSMPVLEEGRTIYAPIRLYSPEEFRQLDVYPNHHYLLARDIVLPASHAGKANWTPLCPDSQTDDGGFTGSLDGGNHTISGLYFPYESSSAALGLFSSIGGGTVRNLNLENVRITGTHQTGALAAENYGYIENCRVSGTMELYQPDESVLAGGICGINYGTLDNTEARMTIRISGTAVTAGGIAAQNEGFIYNTAFLGEIHTAAKDTSNMLLGGICGMNAGGYVYNAYTNITIRADADTGYIGGICGMQTAGELYKCSVRGLLYAAPKSGASSVLYAGGIVGMAESGLVMHSFSTADISASAGTAYTGGICGFCTAATIQNTYAAGAVSATSLSLITTSPLAFAGGIAGYNENGFINGSCTLSPRISTNGAYGKICASTPEGHASDIYVYDNIACTGRRVPGGEDGEPVGSSLLRQDNFFFAPPAEGGRLGWSSVRYDGQNGVWAGEVPGRADYILPLLNGVPYQNTFVMPTLK